MASLGLSLGLPFRRAVGAFTPASLYGPGDIGDYYDSYDLTTLFQDSAGTTPVVAAGDPVGRWNGGRGVSAYIQTSTANKPPYSADGRVNLNRSGVDKYLVTATNFAAVSSGDYFIGVQLTAAPGKFQWYLAKSVGGLFDFHPGTSGSYLVTGGAPLTITDLSSGVNTTCFVQGTSVDGYVSIGGVTQAVAMSGGVNTGTTEQIYPDSALSDLYISRMIKIGRGLTAAEIVSVAAWLAEVP